MTTDKTPPPELEVLPQTTPARDQGAATSLEQQLATAKREIAWLRKERTILGLEKHELKHDRVIDKAYKTYRESRDKLEEARARDWNDGLFSAAKDALIDKGLLFKVPSKRRQMARDILRCEEQLMEDVEKGSRITMAIYDVRCEGQPENEETRSEVLGRTLAREQEYATALAKFRPEKMFTAKLRGEPTVK